MKRRIVVGGIAALVLGLTPAVRAQTGVEGGVVIQSGPVTGHVEVGSPAPVVYREPVREVIVVEHAHRRHGRGHDWWKKHGYRVVTVYYDGSRYYDRQRHTGVRAVVVYERRGRYYRGDEYGKRHRHHRHDHDDHDDDDDEDDDD